MTNYCGFVQVCASVVSDSSSGFHVGVSPFALSSSVSLRTVTTPTRGVVSEVNAQGKTKSAKEDHPEELGWDLREPARGGTWTMPTSLRPDQGRPGCVFLCEEVAVPEAQLNTRSCLMLPPIPAAPGIEVFRFTGTRVSLLARTCHERGSESHTPVNSFAAEAAASRRDVRERPSSSSTNNRATPG